MSHIFWLNDPLILLNKKYIMQLNPTTFEEKLNAFTRLILLLTIIGLMITKSPYLILICILALLGIVYVYNTQSKGKKTEGFKINGEAELKEFLKKEYVISESSNPLGNVLLTDIADNPTRKPAPPSFDIQSYENINENTQKMIQKLNPSIKNTNKQLFGDLGEKFEFDQSQRSFYSTANTRVASDQGAYAQFLYGTMPSCKGGDSIECVKDNPRYNLY